MPEGLKTPLFESEEERKKRETSIAEARKRNQLNTDGSNKDDFNYSGFAVRYPEKNQNTSALQLTTEPAPAPIVPYQTAPLATVEKPQEPEPAPIVPYQTAPLATVEKPQEPVEINIAVGNLTEEEAAQIRRQRVREAQDTQEAELRTGNFAERMWNSLRWSFRKNFEKYKEMARQRGLPFEQIFGEENNQESYQRRADARAQELASNMSEDVFSQSARNGGFQEIYQTNQEDQRIVEGKNQLVSLIKEATINRDLTREVFDRRKNDILNEIKSAYPQDTEAIGMSFDNMWDQVEILRNRFESNAEAANLVDKMQINLNIRFGRARLNHETSDNETISTRVEEAIINSRWLSSLPEKRKMIAIGLIVGVNGAVENAQRAGAKLAVPFLAAGAGGFVAAAFEYKRKRDEMTASFSRATRMLAEGRNVSELSRKYSPQELSRVVTVENIGTLRENIDNSFDRLVNATEEISETERNQRTNTLLQEVARFQSLLEVGRDNKIDLIGLGNNQQSVEVLNEQRTALVERSRTILRTLSSANPETVDRYREILEASKYLEQKNYERRIKQFEILRRNTALKGAVRSGLFSFAGSTILSEISSAFKGDTQGLVESLLGRDAGAKYETSMRWLQRLITGEKITETTKDFQVVTDTIQRTVAVGNPTETTYGGVYSGASESVASAAESAAASSLAFGEDGSYLGPIFEGFERVNGQLASQIEEFGTATRSHWASDMPGWETSADQGILGIRSRLMDSNGVAYNLSDIEGDWVEGVKNGTFNAVATLPDGTEIDVSSVASIPTEGPMAGKIVLDLPKAEGLVGELFKKYGEGGIEYLKNIRYGMDGVQAATIVGGGEIYTPETPIPGPEVPSVVPTPEITDVVQPETEVITETISRVEPVYITEEIKRGIDDIFFTWFGAPRADKGIDRGKKKKSETTETGAGGGRDGEGTRRGPGNETTETGAGGGRDGVKEGTVFEKLTPERLREILERLAELSNRREDGDLLTSREVREINNMLAELKAAGLSNDQIKVLITKMKERLRNPQQYDREQDIEIIESISKEELLEKIDEIAKIEWQIKKSKEKGLEVNSRLIENLKKLINELLDKNISLEEINSMMNEKLAEFEENERRDRIKQEQEDRDLLESLLLTPIEESPGPITLTNSDSDINMIPQNQDTIVLEAPITQKLEREFSSKEILDLKRSYNKFIRQGQLFEGIRFVINEKNLTTPKEQKDAINKMFVDVIEGVINKYKTKGRELVPNVINLINRVIEFAVKNEADIRVIAAVLNKNNIDLGFK
jgi:hypothetical protein